MVNSGFSKSAGRSERKIIYSGYVHACIPDSTPIDMPSKEEKEIKNQIHIQKVAPHVQLLQVAVMLHIFPVS